MTGADPLPPAVLKRKAVVYVRQSTPAQVETNLESRRRQYELVEVARSRGFRDVEVIDDDLGRSASGMVARPGFERLVAWLCAGEVGAVLCLDASRLARNGRDWHHLLELCGLVEARVIDLDGVYDPCRPNDRLLLGMKGSISEFELGMLRARMLDAARAKARRGELRISVPIGYVWHREVGLGFDPDLRLQEAIRLIFTRFCELGSARQALLSLTADGLHFPRPSDGKRMTTFEWTPIRYRNVIAVLKNPFYAGAYVYGKSEKRMTVVDGRPRKSYGHGRPLETWEVLLKGHQEGYIDWAEFELTGVAVLGPAGVLRVSQHVAPAPAEGDRLGQRPGAVGVEGDARVRAASLDGDDGLYLVRALHDAALQLEVGEAVAVGRGLDVAGDGLGRERRLVAQARPAVLRLRIGAVGQVRAGAVADVEQVGQHPRGSALLAGAEQGGDGNAQELTEQVEQRRLHRRDHIVGAQVDLVQLPQQGGFGRVSDLMDGGLASRLISAGQRSPDIAEDCVVEAQRPADDQPSGSLQGLADGLASRHLADPGVARIVLQHHEVAGEVGAVGAAQVQQHAVLPGDRHDQHLGNDRRGGWAALDHLLLLVHSVIPLRTWWARCIQVHRSCVRDGRG